MFRTLTKAAHSLQRGVQSAFTNAPPDHTAFNNTIITIAGIRLRLGSVFAQGAYSFIHVATPVSPTHAQPSHYAVKRIACPDQESLHHAHVEIRFLRQLPPHPNIVKFYDAHFHHAHAFLLFELVDGGTLPHRLQHVQLPTHATLEILEHAAAALAHVHALPQPVFVRDVKLENLLYDRSQRCYKLCDFGSVTTTMIRPQSRAHILQAEEQISSHCTSMYRAPELVDLYSNHFICERADVWALGCVWYAVLFGSLPFDGSSSLQITNGLPTIPTSPSYPQPFIALLQNMLVVNPAHRYDSFQVLEEVRRLQNRPMDQKLRQIGLQLREKRRNDFGHISASSACNPFNPTHSTALTSAQSQPSNLLLDFDHSLSLSEQPRRDADATPTESDFNRSSSMSGNNGWADFDSAFGNVSKAPASQPTAVHRARSSPAPAPNVTVSAGGLPDSTSSHKRNSTPTPFTSFDAFATTNVGHTSERPSSVPPFVSLEANGQTARRDESALVDVFDMQPQTSDGNLGSGFVSNRNSQASAKRSAANFDDLIDFG
ncbi:putative serine/threonine-protein kinase [Gracilariopsis chorda]|uniref:non-specific serine/threonine protein kinase n=1 Tax=Gracilariopsis chorda TaxID=448386 RepID=A0A2V3IJV5_9FLOR|nr:putative serine/threonine-protein kinase [Gracilariopsis chorda]|eukprot:PXF42357.1 putative serine/threonine-protein kinase [Gracilariopsis chorda]